MSRRKSWVWKYASPSENETHATCKVCGDVISYGGSTSGLNKHLKHKHKIAESELCEEVHVPTASTSTSNISTSECETPRKKKHAPEQCSNARQEAISGALAQMVAMCQLPLSFVHSDGFIEFMKIVEPSFKVPYPQAIRARLELWYDKIRGKIVEHLDKASFIAITTDEWSSRAQDAYLSVTAHFIDSEWILRSFTLTTIHLVDRPTAENLAAALEMVRGEWQLNKKLHSIVHDNSLKAAVRLLSDVKDSIKCAAHTLQLCIKDGLNNIPEYLTVCNKASKVVSHFKHSNIATKALGKKQAQLGLKEERLVQSCPTRWDSIYMLCDTLYRNRSAVCAVLADRTYTSSSIAIKLEISEYDWTLMEEMVTVLKPLQIATKIFCSENKITLSAVRPIIRSLLNNHFEIAVDDSHLVILFKEIITISLTTRFNMIPVSSDPVRPDQFASFFDPRYKDLRAEVDTEIDKIRNNAKQKIINTSSYIVQDSIHPTEEDTDLDFIFSVSHKSSDGLSQFQLYLNEPQSGHNSDPLKWWKEHEESYPAIAALAMMYLAIPATSASSERVFSTAGNIVTAKRNCLSAENVNLLVFLHNNKILM